MNFYLTLSAREFISGLCLTFALFFALAGCSTSPHITYYALSATPPLQNTTAVKVSSLAITSITVPEMVDRPHLVVAGAGNQIHIMEFYRWGENLKSAIPRVMAENLSHQPGVGTVSYYPQIAALKTDRTLTIDFQHFDAVEGTVLIDALWTVKQDGLEIKRGRTSVQEKIQDRAVVGFSSLVDAYNRGLESVSIDMAKCLIDLK